MAEEKQHHGLFHHHKSEEKPDEAGVYSETAEYSETATGYDAPPPAVPDVDYRKEEKHHKHLEHVGELGTAAAGAFAMVQCFVSCHSLI
jgi:hypothetical protein